MVFMTEQVNCIQELALSFMLAVSSFIPVYSDLTVLTVDQWLNYSKVGGGTLHFLPFPSLRTFLPLLSPPFPSLSLLSSLSLPSPFFLSPRSRPLKSSEGFWGIAVSSPSGVWGGAPAK